MTDKAHRPCRHCQGNCEVEIQYPSARITRPCYDCDGLGFELNSTRRKALALPMREVYNAAYDAWAAWLEDRAFKALTSKTKKLAAEFHPDRLPAPLRRHGADLKTTVLDHVPGDMKWIECLVTICRNLVAFETPHARCKDCRTTARQGGGPLCECGK